MHPLKASSLTGPATCDNLQRLKRLLLLAGSSAKSENLAFEILSPPPSPTPSPPKPSPNALLSISCHKALLWLSQGVLISTMTASSPLPSLHEETC